MSGPGGIRVYLSLQKTITESEHWIVILVIYLYIRTFEPNSWDGNDREKNNQQGRLDWWEESRP